MHVRFALGEEGRVALARGEKTELEVRHGDDRFAAPLPQETLDELLRDLDV